MNYGFGAAQWSTRAASRNVTPTGVTLRLTEPTDFRLGSMLCPFTFVSVAGICISSECALAATGLLNREGTYFQLTRPCGARTRGATTEQGMAGETPSLRSGWPSDTRCEIMAVWSPPVVWRQQPLYRLSAAQLPSHPPPCSLRWELWTPRCNRARCSSC